MRLVINTEHSANFSASVFQGHPFMESISQNRPFFYSTIFAGTAVVILTLGAMPELNEQFEIVPIPAEVRRDYKLFAPSLQYFCGFTYAIISWLLILFQLQNYMVTLFAADLVGAYIIDRVCMWLFGEGRLRVK